MVEARKYIDFEIIKEKWNKYSLKDGSNLKTRLVLKSVWYTIENNKKNYAFDIQQFSVVMCDPSLQGTKNQTKYTKEQIVKNMEVEDCPYDTMAYEMNEYVLDDSAKIQIHSNLLKLSRTSLFNPIGDRVYHVGMDISISVNAPKP